MNLREFALMSNSVQIAFLDFYAPDLLTYITERNFITLGFV